MSTATETIEGLVKQEYKYGFYTDVETDSAPPGLSEDTIRLISRQEKRAGMADRLAAQGVPPLANDDGADLAESSSRKNQLPGHHLLLRAEEKGRRAEKPGGSGSEIAGDLRETRHPAARNANGWPAWRWTRCLTACPSARRSKSSSPRRASSSARSARRCRNIPTW